MSEKRICLNCGSSIPEYRQSGAKYCNDSCKARYHEKKLLKELFGKNQDQDLAPQETVVSNITVKQEIPKPVVNLSDGLRGVSDSSSKIQQPLSKELKTGQAEISAYKQETAGQQVPVKLLAPQFVPMTVKVETLQYKTAKGQIEKIQVEIKRVKDMINACDEQIQKIKNGNIPFFPASTIAAGGIIGYEKTDKNLLGALSGAIVGWGTGALIDHLFFEEARKKEKKESLEKLQIKKLHWQNQLAELNDICKEWEDYILTAAHYETKIEMRPHFLGLLKPMETNSNADDDKKTEIAQAKTEKSDEPFFESKFPARIVPPIQTNDKIITSKELKEMDYPCLNFLGKWNDLLGNPATVFHLVVHGKPGEGKSTFCIQFANYLAEHHGSTVYISGEEGFSKTLQQKIIITKAESPNLFFADLKSLDEIKKQIENKFNFIFIDSLDTLRIDSVKLKELRELFQCSAFITISQSTKDGKMRGSQEIVHDADITVTVQDGFAITTKNRFKEKGMQFIVFPKSK
ncbi:MAG: hypothetical protein HY840_14525 [Bacteroidetes bacterium]|nr:hypothetical protein [Bacteroidota bacterium]